MGGWVVRARFLSWTTLAAFAAADNALGASRKPTFFCRAAPLLRPGTRGLVALGLSGPLSEILEDFK